MPVDRWIVCTRCGKKLLRWLGNEAQSERDSPIRAELVRDLEGNSLPPGTPIPECECTGAVWHGYTVRPRYDSV